MNNSDTPRVDDMEWEVFQRSQKDGTWVVSPIDALQLERELNLAIQEFQSWENWAREVLTDWNVPFDNHTIGLRLAITQKMADDRAEFELFRKQAMTSALMCENADLKQSRDDWKQCAEALIDYANHSPNCPYPVKPCDCGFVEQFEAFEQLTDRISGTGK